MFIAVSVVLVMHSMRKNVQTKDSSGRYKQVFRTLLNIMLVMIIFGLSWFSAAMTIAQASIAFQYVFVICSTSQGFILFLFYCVFSKPSRDEWLRFLRCGKVDHRKHATSLSTSTESRYMQHRRSSSSYRPSPPPSTSSLNVYSRSSLLRRPEPSPESSQNIYDVIELKDSKCPDKKLDSIKEEEEIDLDLYSEVNTDDKAQLIPLNNTGLHAIHLDTLSVGFDMLPTPQANAEMVVIENEYASSSEDEAPDVQVPPHILARMQGSSFHKGTVEDANLEDTNAKPSITLTELTQSLKAHVYESD